MTTPRTISFGGHQGSGESLGPGEKPLPGRKAPATRIERDHWMHEIVKGALRPGLDRAARISGAGDGNRTRVSSLEG